MTTKSKTIPNDLTTITEAAKLTGRSTSTLYAWANRQNKLTRYEMDDGKSFKVSKEEVERVHREAKSRKLNSSTDGNSSNKKSPACKVIEPSSKSLVESNDQAPPTTNPSGEVQSILIARINFHRDTQIREKIDPETVKQYAERMREGDRFQPVVLFADDLEKGDVFIGDGWHRLKAARQIGYQHFPADIRLGGLAAAADYALSANATHGKPRTHKDIRRAIQLACRRHSDLSNRQIAKLCAVDDKTVAAHRESCGNSAPAKRKGADGKTYPANASPRVPSDKQIAGSYKRLKKSVRKLPRAFQERLRELLESILNEESAEKPHSSQ